MFWGENLILYYSFNGEVFCFPLENIPNTHWGPCTMLLLVSVFVRSGSSLPWKAGMVWTSVDQPNWTPDSAHCWL